MQRRYIFVELCVPEVPAVYFDVGVVTDEVDLEGLPEHLVGLESTIVEVHDALTESGEMMGHFKSVDAVNVAS